MKLYCGCDSTCTCLENYEGVLDRPASPVANLMINLAVVPNQISQGTQTENSQFAQDALQRVNMLLHITTDRETERLLKDIKRFITQ